MTTMAERMFEESLAAKFNNPEFEAMIGEDTDPAKLAVVIIEKIIEDAPDTLNGRPSMVLTVKKPTSHVVSDLEQRIPGITAAAADILPTLPEEVETAMEFRFLPDGSGFCRIKSDEYSIAARLVDVADPAMLFADQPDISPEEYPAIIEAFKAVFNSNTGTVCMPFTPASFAEIRSSLLDTGEVWKEGTTVTNGTAPISVAEFDMKTKECFEQAHGHAKNDLASKLKNRQS